MAAHASDWGDSLKPSHRGGKSLIIVVMFAVEFFIVDGTFRTIHTTGNLRSGSFLFLPNFFFVTTGTKIGVKLLMKGKIGNISHPGHVEIFRSHRKFTKFFYHTVNSSVLISHFVIGC